MDLQATLVVISDSLEAGTVEFLGSSPQHRVVMAYGVSTSTWP